MQIYVVEFYIYCFSLERILIIIHHFTISLQEQETAQASEQHCVQLEKAHRELERQLSSVSERLQEEEACSAQLAIYRDRLEAECSSLRRDLDELENALTAAEHDRQVDLFIVSIITQGEGASVLSFIGSK